MSVTEKVVDRVFVPAVITFFAILDIAFILAIL